MSRFLILLLSGMLLGIAWWALTLKSRISKLQKLIQGLAHAVQERDERLQDNLRQRNEFITLVSHELKTPLTALGLQLQTLMRVLWQDRYPDARRQELLAKFTQTSNQQVVRLSRIIEDLMSVSRIQAGKLELELERFDLSRLVFEVVERYRPEMMTAGCELRFLTDGEIFGNWDRFRVEQIVVNLLANAMKFGRGKPVDIEVSAYGDSSAQILVRDHGAGIAREDHEKVFSRFERAVADGRVSGLGFGLFISRQIAQAHGGSIRVISDAGVGASFSVVLPVDLRLTQDDPESLSTECAEMVLATATALDHR